MTQEGFPEQKVYDLNQYGMDKELQTSTTVTYKDEGSDERSRNIVSRLSDIQRSLIAGKNKTNKFGNYAYRNAEDILLHTKQLLNADETISINDDLLFIEGTYFIKSTAIFKTIDGEISRSAYAAIPFGKKGVDASQCTGMAASYAKKYALQNLLICSSEPDADSMDTREHVNAVQQNDDVNNIDMSINNLKTLAKNNNCKKETFERLLQAFEIKDDSCLTMANYKSITQKLLNVN